MEQKEFNVGDKVLTESYLIDNYFETGEIVEKTQHPSGYNLYRVQLYSLAKRYYDNAVTVKEQELQHLPVELSNG